MSSHDHPDRVRNMESAFKGEPPLAGRFLRRNLGPELLALGMAAREDQDVQAGVLGVMLRARPTMRSVGARTMAARCGCVLSPAGFHSTRCGTRVPRCSPRPECTRRSRSRFCGTPMWRRRSRSTRTSIWATCATHFRGPLLPICCQRGQTQKVKPATAPRSARRIAGFGWSGRLDLNQRPLAPQASALPGCATPRHCDSR